MQTQRRVMMVLFAVLVISCVTTTHPSHATNTTLGDLIASDGSLTVNDKVFSGFAWTGSRADGSLYDPNKIGVVSLEDPYNPGFQLQFNGQLAARSMTQDAYAEARFELHYDVMITGPPLGWTNISVTPAEVAAEASHVDEGQAGLHASMKTTENPAYEFAWYSLDSEARQAGNIWEDFGPRTVGGVDARFIVYAETYEDDVWAEAVIEKIDLRHNQTMVEAAIPEPSTIALLITGLLSFAGYRRRNY